MIKRAWIVGCCLAFWGIVLILIAILAPIILGNLLKSNIHDGVKMNSENGVKLWGELPGSTDCIMYQNFHFFNILNPEGVMEGEPPYLEEKSGYLYQEYDKFIRREHKKINGTDILRFNLLVYEKITHHTKWPDNLSPNDQIMQVSLGALGAWYQLKHVPRVQLALAALYTVISGLEQSLLSGALTSGISGFLGNFETAKLTIFRPANISDAAAWNIWYDYNYGMGNNSTLLVWVQAFMENSNNTFTFQINRPISGSLYVIWQYFGLTTEQIMSIFTGRLALVYELLNTMFYYNYDCTNPSGLAICDPVYLSAIQWVNSTVTLFPPGGSGASISIATSNSSNPGYPELYYYFDATSTASKYPDFSFASINYTSLFYYNRKTGFPEYSNTSATLLDVGRFNNFFELGLSGNFTGISNTWGLGSVDSARVLWDYMNGLVDFAALQGCYDPAVYNIDNRGMATEASMANVGTQALYQLLVGMSQTMPVVISSIYYSLMLDHDGLYCQDLIGSILGGDYSSICSIYSLEWSPSSNGIALWIQTYWNDVNSTYWQQFKALSGLSYSNMTVLFTTNNTLTNAFAIYDLNLKAQFKCNNTGLRCDPMYLAKMQWGQALVTNNLPGIFSTIFISNSSSIMNYQYLSMGLTGTPEYYSYTCSKGSPDLLSEDQINFILSFNGLLGSTPFQVYFINEYRNAGNLNVALYSLSAKNQMTGYLRYMIDLYALGGLIKPKSVDQILWNDYEPLLIAAKTLNPLLGGNPATDLNSTSLGGNMTQDNFDSWPLNFKDGMESGETHVNKVRTYRLYGGSNILNVPTDVYMGEGENGPIIQKFNYNPWDADIFMDGTDAWSFRPYITKHDKIKFFLNTAALIFNAKYMKDTTVRHFDCLRFKIDSSILMNATENPDNAMYYAFAPTGLVNETSVFQAPLFGSKPYYLDADPMLLKLVKFADQSLVVPENYESIFEVEKYSGTVLHAMEQLQYNIELKPDNLYPKLGLYNLQNYGYKTYMPMFFLQRSELLSQHIVDKYFGIIHTVLDVILALMIIGYVLGSILLILLGIYIWKKHRNNKINSIASSQIGHSLVTRGRLSS